MDNKTWLDLQQERFKRFSNGCKIRLSIFRKEQNEVYCLMNGVTNTDTNKCNINDCPLWYAITFKRNGGN